MYLNKNSKILGLIVTISIIFSTACSTSVHRIESVDTSPKIFSYHGLKYSDEYSWIKDDNNSIEPSQNVQKIIDNKNQIADKFFSRNNDAINYVSNYMGQFTEINRHSFPIKSEMFDLFFDKTSDSDDFYKINITTHSSAQTRTLLDVQSRSEQSESYEFGGFDISDDGKRLVFKETLTGHFAHDLFFLDDEQPPQLLSQDVTDFAIEANGRYVVYVVNSLEVRIFDVEKREHRTLRKEQNKDFTARVNKSKTNGVLTLSVGNASLTEVSLLDFRDNEFTEQIVVSRGLNVGVSLDLIDGVLYGVIYSGRPNAIISTNLKRKSDIAPIEKWQQIFVANTNASINQNLFFEKWLVFGVRANGTDSLFFYDVTKQELIQPDLPDDLYTVWLRNSLPSDESAGIYRFWYESYLTPRTVVEVNVQSMNVNIIPTINQNSTYDKSNYLVRRELVPSHDGVTVPTTIIYHKNTALDGTAPALIYAYGAYGNGIGAEFSSMSMSLVDRGFIYAVAHVRGGNELGNAWYENGTRLNKKNSFEDFLYVIRYLNDSKFTKYGNISMRGESASGLIVGYALNQHPNWFKSATVLVPFLDPLSALLDESLPYVDFDRVEFGNPVESKEVFNYVKSYSPFANLTKQKYPHTYMTGGINDPSAGYWEPLKWSLKKESLNINDTLSLVSLREGGHIANTAEKRKQEFVKQMAFVLWSHDINTF